jgi:hypothetical protein
MTKGISALASGVKISSPTPSQEKRYISLGPLSIRLWTPLHLLITLLL